nr:hypothetical protein [Tanacetum cinerariifolium]
MELEMEQSQQGSSHEVSVSTEGFEELKRIVRINGEKKEALHTTLGRNQSSTHFYWLSHSEIVDIEKMGNNAKGTGAAGNGGAQNRVGNVNSGQARQIKCYNCTGGQDNAIDEDVDEPSIQDLALNTMFMENLSFADSVYDEAGPSYDSYILSEVYDHDKYHDAVCEHHEVHEMHDDIQPNGVVDSDAFYTGDSNMIPYDRYMKDNAKLIVQNNVSFVPHDASMVIINEIHEQTTQRISVKAHTKVVDASLTAELATYKEQVELYERRAKLELTKREQKIEEQLRIVITDRDIKEENLKRELHFVKMKLNSTINHN